MKPDKLESILDEIHKLIEKFGWTKQQKREYLKEKFGRGGISLLNENELLQLRDNLKKMEEEQNTYEQCPWCEEFREVAAEFKFKLVPTWDNPHSGCCNICEAEILEPCELFRDEYDDTVGFY